MERKVITANGDYNFPCPLGASFVLAASGTFPATLTLQYNSGMVDSATQATGVFTGIGIADGDTVTIGDVIYTFMDTLSTEPDVPYEVAVGINDDASVANLIAAINNEGGEGTAYATGTEPHPLVTALIDANEVMDVTAIAYGDEGESIATTASITGAGDWQAATLAGAIPLNTMVDVWNPFATTALALTAAGEKSGVNCGAHAEINVNVANCTPGTTSVVVVFNSMPS